MPLKRLHLTKEKHRHYLDFPLKYSFSAANFVRKLSLIATEAVKLIEIEINPVSQGLTFSLRGLIKAVNNIEARAKFLQYYQALKRFEDILHMESSKVKVKPGEKKHGKRDKQVKLYFTVKGEIETW